MKAMRKSNLGRSLLLVVPLVCCPYTAHKAYATQTVTRDSRCLVGIGIYFGKPKKKETFIYNSS